MTQGAVSVRSSASLLAARELLQLNGIHHLLVIDDGSVVGVVSYRDLIVNSDRLTVGEVMSRDVVTVDPDETIRCATSRLLGKTHGCAAVLEENEVRGVLTTTDLLRAVSVRPEH